MRSGEPESTGGMLTKPRMDGNCQQEQEIRCALPDLGLDSLEGVDGAVEVHQIVGDIELEPASVGILEPCGQPVIGGTHREVLKQPVLEAGIEP